MKVISPVNQFNWVTSALKNCDSLCVGVLGGPREGWQPPGLLWENSASSDPHPLTRMCTRAGTHKHAHTPKAPI